MPSIEVSPVLSTNYSIVPQERALSLSMQAESSAMGAEEVRTLRPRKKLKPYSSYAEEDKEEKSNPTHTKPMKSAKKAKVGKLSGLLTMPLDILFEVSL